MNRRAAFAVIGAAMAVTGVLQFLAARAESQTFDEGVELVSGYAWLKTGEYWVNREHPPLARVLAALPLLVWNLPLPAESFRRQGLAHPYGVEFLYHNRVPAGRILLAARSAMIVLVVLGVLALAWWTWRRAGPAAAVIAALFFAFDPTVLSSGHYVKNDLPGALLFFGASVAWIGFLVRGRRRDVLLAAALTGLATVTKFSCLLLFPVFVATYVASRLAKATRVRPRRFLLALAAAAGLTAASVVVMYAPQTRLWIPRSRAARALDPSVPMLRDAPFYSPASRALRWVAARAGIPAHPFFMGLMEFADHSQRGHPAYLLGKTSSQGWWYYFPVVFLVKTPVATLLALAVALFVVARRPRPAPEWMLFTIPPLIYLLSACAGHVNIGLRHLLPALLFLYAGIGVALARLPGRAGQAAAPVLAALLLAEVLWIHPHYLAFFNRLAGGPEQGPRYLVDSNLDWGQDLKHLADYVRKRGIANVRLIYFGTAETAYYGIERTAIPATWETAERQALDGVVAISVTALYDVYGPPGYYAWLRDLRPIARIGYTIYLYDLRKGRR